MKKQFLILLSILSIIGILSSCQKDAPTTVSAYPLLSITMPTSGQQFTAGTTVHIMGTATASGTDDIHLLHELALNVKRVSTGATIWSAIISTHDESSHTIDTTFIVPNAITDSLVLNAQISNHIPNVTTVNVGFKVHS